MKSPLAVTEPRHHPKRTTPGWRFKWLLRSVTLLLVVSFLASAVLEAILNTLVPLDSIKVQIEDTVNQTLLSKPGAETGLALKLGSLSLKPSWRYGLCTQISKIGLYEAGPTGTLDASSLSPSSLSQGFLEKHPGIFIPKATICIRALPFLSQGGEKQLSWLELEKPLIAITPTFLNKLKKIDLTRPP